jgi:hypothetical protein
MFLFLPALKVSLAIFDAIMFATAYIVPFDTKPEACGTINGSNVLDSSDMT